MGRNFIYFDSNVLFNINYNTKKDIEQYLSLKHWELSGGGDGKMSPLEAKGRGETVHTL